MHLQHFLKENIHMKGALIVLLLMSKEGQTISAAELAHSIDGQQVNDYETRYTRHKLPIPMTDVKTLAQCRKRIRALKMLIEKGADGLALASYQNEINQIKAYLRDTTEGMRIRNFDSPNTSAYHMVFQAYRRLLLKARNTNVKLFERLNKTIHIGYRCWCSESEKNYTNDLTNLATSGEMLSGGINHDTTLCSKAA